MDVGSERKAKTFKRGYKKSRSRLASAMAKGKAKAKARARARAVARAELDFYCMEPSLGPNIFDETDSESDSVSEITTLVLLNMEWVCWSDQIQNCVCRVAEKRSYVESNLIDV